MRAALGLAVCVLASCCARSAAPASQEMPREDAATPFERKTTMSHDDAGAPPAIPLPTVLVEAAPRYMIGFPFVVAVTYENHLDQVDFYKLPDLGLLDAPWGIGLHLVPTSGGAPYDLKPGMSQDEFAHGVALNQGERRRMLQDLSNFGVWVPGTGPRAGSAIQPGTYRMTLVLQQVKATTTSNPVTIEILDPTPADAQEAARLRKLGHTGFDNGGWKAFLSSNWSTVVPSPSLSFEAQRQLALHLFLHRAFYGPEPVARVDESLLGRVTEAHLGAEVAALRYEIAAAKGDPGAKQLSADLLSRWPGLGHRVAAGGGLLAQGRRAYGAEKTHLRPPPSTPYAP
jgi:hypothetical protein